MKIGSRRWEQPGQENASTDEIESAATGGDGRDGTNRNDGSQAPIVPMLPIIPSYRLLARSTPSSPALQIQGISVRGVLFGIPFRKAEHAEVVVCCSYFVSGHQEDDGGDGLIVVGLTGPVTRLKVSGFLRIEGYF